MIKRPYQGSTAVYQLAKLQMLEFCYDFLDRYLNWQNFELCYMDTDSLYLSISGEFSDDIAKPRLRQAYEVNKKNWLATEKFSKRITGLFKSDGVGTRGVWPAAKCYLVQN